MKQEQWIVKESDVRPARPDGTCFYCGVPLGEEHKIGCVIRSQSVVVDYTFRTILSVPEDWDEERINFYMNNSSSCASNRLFDLIRHYVKEGRDICICNLFTGEYIREASLKDLDFYIPSDENKNEKE